MSKARKSEVAPERRWYACQICGEEIQGYDRLAHLRLVHKMDPELFLPKLNSFYREAEG